LSGEVTPSNRNGTLFLLLISFALGYISKSSPSVNLTRAFLALTLKGHSCDNFGLFFF